MPEKLSSRMTRGSGKLRNCDRIGSRSSPDRMSAFSVTTRHSASKARTIDTGRKALLSTSEGCSKTEGMVVVLIIGKCTHPEGRNASKKQLNPYTAGGTGSSVRDGGLEGAPAATCFLYSAMVACSILRRVAMLSGCAMSLISPSFMRRDGMRTDMPLGDSTMRTLWMTKELSNVMDAQASRFSFAFGSYSRTVFLMRTSVTSTTDPPRRARDQLNPSVDEPRFRQRRTRRRGANAGQTDAAVRQNKKGRTAARHRRRTESAQPFAHLRQLSVKLTEVRLKIVDQPTPHPDAMPPANGSHQIGRA